jgi:small subunit ribosomal protein S13
MRLFGVNIPDNKRLEIALTSVYGIGRSAAGKIVAQADIDTTKHTQDLSQNELNRVKQIVSEHYKIEGELRQGVRQNISRLKNIKSYRGSRHAKNLPARGQSTKRNARTLRGSRRTVGSGRRKLTLK